MEKFEITKEQIEKLTKNSTRKQLKEWFPEAFKTEVEPEKWYWYNSEGDTQDSLVFIRKDKTCYGFDRNNTRWYDGEWVSPNYYWVKREATKEQVEEALIKEAKRRGFKEEVIHNCYDKSTENLIESNKILMGWNIHEYALHFEDTEGLIFNKGKWAEIIKEKPKRKMTVSQICEELGEEIEIIK